MHFSKTLFLFLLILNFIFCGQVKAADKPTKPASALKSVTQSLVFGKADFSCPEIPQPKKSEAIFDPDFHTRITRVTDRSDGYTGPGIENEYSRSDPENCDASLVILRGNDGEWYLYDARTFQLKKHLNEIVGGGEEPEPRWDAQDPQVFYFLFATELRSFNVATNSSSPIYDFKKDFPKAAYISTKTEGDASLDRRFWCFMVEDKDYRVIAVVTFDKSTKAILGRKDKFPDAINWVSMDMSGKHCVIGYEDSDTDKDEITPPVGVFSKDFSTALSLPNGATGHMDLALTGDGKDVMVYQNNATDWIAMADLDTGIETLLVEIPFSVNGDIGLHFSGNCSRTAGWVLVSTYGSKNPAPGQKHSWMDNQLFMVELKADPEIWRITHTHSFTSKDYNGEKNYFAECFATINQRGNRIYFGSNWNRFAQDYSDTYQVELADNWIGLISKK